MLTPFEIIRYHAAGKFCNNCKHHCIEKETYYEYKVWSNDLEEGVDIVDICRKNPKYPKHTPKNNICERWTKKS